MELWLKGWTSAFRERYLAFETFPRRNCFDHKSDLQAHSLLFLLVVCTGLGPIKTEYDKRWPATFFVKKLRQ